MIKQIAKLLDKKNLFFPGLLFSPFYDRIDKRPSFFALAIDRHLSRLLSLSLPNGTQKAFRWNATRMPAITTPSERISNPPEIELLIVAAEKDFVLLLESSQRAIENSLNRISKVTFIIPACSRESFPDLSLLPVELRIVDEDTLIDSSLLNRLRSSLKERSGWLLQQYLTIKFVEESQARGVLTLDADTLIIEPQLWLDASNRQILHVSSEYVRPYYEFLATIGVSETVPITTHVTHHMLMQPWLLRSIFEKLSTNSVKVLEQALDFHVKTGQIQFCLEFELYAQGARRFHEEQLRFGKFCNRTVLLDSRKELAVEIANLVGNAKGLYQSISAHSYSQFQRKN
jgi:hypothetical protein